MFAKIFNLLKSIFSYILPTGKLQLQIQFKKKKKINNMRNKYINISSQNLKCSKKVLNNFITKEIEINEKLDDLIDQLKQKDLSIRWKNTENGITFELIQISTEEVLNTSLEFGTLVTSVTNKYLS